jgi:hypothetical protein
MLELSFAGNDIVLTWPTSATNYLLETTANLSPGVSWTFLTNNGVIVGDKWVLTNHLNQEQAFYRLRQ